MDPYKVLGVSPSASEDEIREAYRKLVKKYHPDRYQDSALKEKAEEKMKEINAAYEMLTKGGGSTGSSYGQSSSGSYGSGSYGSGSYGSGSYGTGGWGGFGGFGQGAGSYGQGSYGQGSYGSGYGQSSSRQYASEFNKVRSYLNSGDVSAAQMLLNSIPLRNAEWFFLSGMCCYRNGQYSRAYEYISRACTMDPSNAEYRTALNSIRGASGSARTWTQNGSSMSYCGLCSSLLCANLLCNCCCRGRNY